MKKIQPINTHFIETFTYRSRSPIEYYDFFEEKINSIADHAIGTHIWLIFNLSERKVEMVSENIEQFTPFKRNDWLHDIETDFFNMQFHPEDRDYLQAAFQLAESMRFNLGISKKETLKFNFYGRMLDKNNEYRLVMIKCIAEYINENDEVEASLVVIYDISHFNIENHLLMSMIDYSKKETHYYKYIEKEIKSIEMDTPKIGRREKEILELMCLGYNTPEIAEKLYISYHTVENHKRNLRKKTNTKTSSELVAYVMIHNLM